MQAHKPTAAWGAQSQADGLVERLACADLAVPTLPPPPLLSPAWAEYVLHDARSLSESQSELDVDAQSLVDHKHGDGDTIRSVAVEKPDCLAPSSDLTLAALDLVDPQDLGTKARLHRMSAPAASAYTTNEKDEDALHDALERIAETQMRMDNQRAPPPSLAMNRRSSAASAGVLLPRPPLNEMVTRLRGRSYKRLQHESASRSCSAVASKPGMNQQLDHLLNQLEAASASRLEAQRAQPPLPLARRARTQSQPEFFGTTTPRLSLAEDPDTQNLLDCLERAGRNWEEQRAQPPTPTARVPLSAPSSEGESLSPRPETPVPHGSTLVDRLRGANKCLDSPQHLPSGSDDVETSPRSRLRQGSIDFARAIAFSLPGMRHSAARQPSPSPLGAQQSKRRMSKLALRLHPAGSRSTSAARTSTSSRSPQRGNASLECTHLGVAVESSHSNGAASLAAGPSAPSSTASPPESALPVDPAPSSLSTPLPRAKSGSLTTPIQLYAEWQVHLHTLVVIIWAKDGDAIPLSATARITDCSPEPFDVDIMFPGTTSSSAQLQKLIIQPPANTTVSMGSGASNSIPFAGKGTAAEPLLARIPCTSLAGHPAPEAHDGDSMGLAGLPKRLECCVCKDCNAQLIIPRDGGRRLLPLPSAGWEELVDAWMCHEDQLINRAVQRGKEVLYPDRDGVHATANTPHANTVFASEFWLVPKLADVIPGAMRWAPGAKGSLLYCTACNAFLGRAEQTAEPAAGQEGEARCYFARPYIALASPAANGATNQELNTFPARAAALLASACDLGAERRVQLVDDGSSPAVTGAPAETRIWLFQPLAYVAAQAIADGPVSVPPAVKVLFRGPPDTTSTEPNAASEAVPLPLPGPVRRDLLALLEERHARMPAPLASALGWQAAWL